MKQRLAGAAWCLKIIAGCGLFALGFDWFLAPNNINVGGLSGLAMVFVHLTNVGSVGLVALIANVPLFLAGWRKIGRTFLVGSLIGSVALSGWLELFERFPAPIGTEPLLGALYGGLLCGIGSGLVFTAGASTGGSDIAARLLKRKLRNVPIGKMTGVFNGVVVLLTGLAVRDASSVLYCGVTLYVCSLAVDAIVYRFDYSKVAMIITKIPEDVTHAIWKGVSRGVTYLYGQGAYSGRDTKVLVCAVKRQQMAELKECVMKADPEAFVMLLESHQVLGSRFAEYSENEL